MPSVPTGASSAVLKPSDPIPADAVSVKGPSFDTPLSLSAFLRSYDRIGFQASSFGQAVRIVDNMVRLSPHMPCLRHL
jgi:deoxyhypusine synthase